MQATREDCKDEPPWLIDQLLSRRRDELVQQWEEREERLRTAKAKETDIEERLRKRQRVANGTDAAMSRQSSEDDSDWLLTEREEIDTDSWDALSGLSRESRDVLEQLGLGGKQKREQGENHAEEEIKVRGSLLTHRPHRKITLVDLLHVENPLAAFSIYSRITPPFVPFFIATLSGKRPGSRCGGVGEIATSLFAPATLY